MKALMLIGARTNGTADALCSQREKGYLKNPHIILKKIHLFNKMINSCLGCRQCGKTGTCVWKDDACDILNQILEADVLAFASTQFQHSSN